MSRLLLIITALIFAACADSTNKNFKKNDDLKISEMITEGKTTKQEIKTTFGDPTDIDLDKNGREKWTYSYSEASKNPLNYVPVISIFNGQDGMTRKMVIVFEKDIVKTYAISANNEKIKKGILSKSTTII